ncbi:MAG TPA: ribbon-helix-helix protein, CopG family [Polyangia bacterium]
MSQLTIYLPDELAASLRRDAKKAGKSLSAYMAELATGQRRGKGGWPEEFNRLYGACRGELVEAEDPPPDELPRS